MPQPRQNKKSPRGSVTRASAKAVLVYFPTAVVGAVDAAVATEDTDRSKWIRKAVREALQRRGVN